MSKQLLSLVLCLYCLAFSFPLHAATQDRVATRVQVESDLNKDLALDWTPLPALEKRTCIDGRRVADFKGDIVEYWANIECPYCTIQEVAKTQRDNPEMCIVVRHSPTEGYSESVKKALSYEALREYSVNAANQFWLAVMPKTNIAIPSPYGSALQTALQEAAIDMEKFSETLTGIAKDRVSEDIVASRQRILSTPTFVLDGLRFPACDFKAAEIPVALDLAKKARQGDADARGKITEIIIHGILGETML